MSTVQVWLAGVRSVAPCEVAATWKVCDPFAKLEYVFGEVQALKADPSRLHVNVDPVMVAVKLKLAEVVLTVPVGPAVIVVSGARLTVHVRLAGVGSVMPCAVAATWKVWEPFVRLV